MSAAASPALIIHFPPDTSAASRDRLVALLADYDLVAIQEDDLTAPRTWTAHFASAEARDAAATSIGAPGQGTPLQTEIADVEDDDWARRTQADLPAVRVGGVIIAPPWDLPNTSAGIVVEIEPSRGFGTGHHQSTRLAVALLQARALGGRTLLDVGTGSGVLAIVAAKLGAAVVAAIDTDPDAVENARENVSRNHVDGTVTVHVQDLSEPGLAAADVVTANLTGTLLARHAAALCALVRPAGSLIVSGFNVEEKELVAAAFADRFALAEAADEDDWWAYVMVKIS